MVPLFKNIYLHINVMIQNRKNSTCIIEIHKYSDKYSDFVLRKLAGGLFLDVNKISTLS